MEIVREIVLMLIRRKRATARIARSAPHSQLQYHRGMRDEAAKASEIAHMIYRIGRGGSPHLEIERKRVLALSVQREEFVVLDDGYAHYWPHGSPYGALTAWELRTLADELDRRNRLWDARLRRGLGSN